MSDPHLGWHTVYGPQHSRHGYEPVRVNGHVLYRAGSAWGTGGGDDQPKWYFAVTDPPDAEALTRGWYHVHRTPFLILWKAGRDEEENAAVHAAMRTIGASAMDGGRAYKLPRAVSYSEWQRHADVIREARQGVVDRQRREREDRESRESARESSHVAAIAALRPGTPVKIVVESVLGPMFSRSEDGVFEAWDGRAAIVRMRPEGRKRSARYRISPRNIGVP